MTTREQLRALDPAIVDIAIKRILNQDNTFSCIALLSAQRISPWMLLDSEIESNVYIKAYKDNTWVLGMKPLWWNSVDDHIPARVQALEDFRDAIIVAKNSTIPERMKAWLKTPCDYAYFS